MKKEIKLSKTQRSFLNGSLQTLQREIEVVEAEECAAAAKRIRERRETAAETHRRNVTIAVAEASGREDLKSVEFTTDKSGNLSGFTYEEPEPKPTLKDAIAELEEPAPDFKVLAPANGATSPS